jgi:D-3-phosphoglycerate dehydrogenase
MNALILAPFSVDVLQQLKRIMTVHYEPWTKTQTIWDPEELAKRVTTENVGILIVEADFLVEELFTGTQSLSLCAMCRAGLNQVDIDAATQAGVVIVHTPGRNAQAVAELTMGLMFTLARHITRAHSFVTGGHWQDPVEPYTALRGVELSGKTLGIVGLGATGRRVAQAGLGLGMRVLGYDPYIVSPGRKWRGTILTPLDELLRASHFITLHVPETPETEDMLNARRLALLPKDAFLVNTSSPSAVNQDALVKALTQGQLGGAAFDVHDSHPIPPNSPLLKLGNVVLTPHIGGATDSTIERYSRMVYEDIERFLASRKPRNLVNPEVWRRRRRVR